MKSLWGSLGLVRNTGSTLEGPPRSGAGIIPYPDEEQLAHLWIDITKSENGCRKISEDVLNYQDAVKNVQSDEALVKGLSDSNVLTLSSTLREAADEYLSVSMEMKGKSGETCSNIQEVLGDSVRIYHGIYEHLDTLRKRRDLQLSEVQRIQEKLDRLKLKGKKTTDAIVEKDRAFKQMKDLHIQLVTEAKKFHDMRVPFILPCLQAYVQLQVEYYGSSASAYNNQIKVSRGANTVKDPEYFTKVDQNLSAIKALKIVNL